MDLDNRKERPMPTLPNPDSVIRSDAFATWCRAVNDYIENFEDQIIEKIAEKRQPAFQRSGIVQGVCPRTFLAQLEEIGLFPMPRADESHAGLLLFAPLPESMLNTLCQGTHSLCYLDQQIQVRLKRSTAYLNSERELCCYFDDRMIEYWAKHEYLQDLCFPFLPYSRKFLELELPAAVKNSLSREPDSTTIVQCLTLNDGRPANEAGMRVDLVPVWNVRARRLTAGPQVSRTGEGLYVWQPRSGDILDQGKNHIIHRALDQHGNPVAVRMNQGRIESDLKFHTLEFSTIHDVQHLPSILTYPVVGTRKVNLADNYWYRNFFQSISFTHSDLAILLQLLPETKGYLHLARTELGQCSQTIYNKLVSDQRPFFDYLWYLDSDKQVSSPEISGVRLLELSLEPLVDKDKNGEFLLQDRVNYFVSVCRMYLPVILECWGGLR
jgi:hypothetical protein